MIKLGKVISSKRLKNEWNFEKNSDFDINKLTLGSHRIVWWRCEKNHEWKSTIKNRHYGSNCPFCNSGNQTSFPEQTVYYYIKKIFKNAQNRLKIFGKEIDIFIPERNIGIEYNGYYFHQNVQKDLNKKAFFMKKNIKMFYIIESNTLNEESAQNFYIKKAPTYKDLDYLINKLIDVINKETKIKDKIVIDSKKDELSILKNYKKELNRNSFGFLKPELIKDWNFQKNLNLNPFMFNVKSKQKVWWKCENEHEWKTTVQIRANGSMCPYCSNKKVMPGYNDLESSLPEILKFWDFEKNPEHPNFYSKNSNKIIFLKCVNNHSFKSNPYKFSIGQRCPYCANRLVFQGFNDLATVNPEIANQLDEKKSKTTAKEITKSSGKLLWWKCSNGHNYKSRVNDRTRGVGCPYCANKKILKGFNDLVTTNKIVAKTWDFKKNSLFKPEQFTKGSDKIVFWKCKKGCSWSTKIGRRIKQTKCPICKTSLID
jgi:hypothetical protein